MRRFDSHIHLFEHGFGGDRPAGAELVQYERLRTVAGIDAALVVAYEGQGFAGNNAYVLELAAVRGWIIPFVYLHLPGSGAEGVVPPGSVQKQVEKAIAGGARGLALYVEPGSGDLADVPRSAWTVIEESGAALSVNAPARVWAEAKSWLSAHNVPVLVSHMGLPGPGSAAEGGVNEDMLQPVLALAEFPHVAVKLSGAYAIDPRAPHVGAAPVVRRILDAFGTERVCWGSDFSPALTAVDETAMLALPAGTEGLTDAERDAILGGNLRRLLSVTT